MPQRLLTNREVCQRLTLSRTQLHFMCKRGEFPEPLRLGRARRWREADVDNWIAALGREDAAQAPPTESGTDGAGPAPDAV